MTSVVLDDGQTGHVQFDARGDRFGSLYNVVNVQSMQLDGHKSCQPSAHSSGSPCKPTLVSVGTYGIRQVTY